MVVPVPASIVGASAAVTVPAATGLAIDVGEVVRYGDAAFGDDAARIAAEHRAHAGTLTGSAGKSAGAARRGRKGTTELWEIVTRWRPLWFASNE